MLNFNLVTIITIPLSRHNKKEITINEEYLLEQFKEEIAEELSIDKKKLNKEEEK